MTFSKRLADLRKKRGLTQQALSGLVGVKALQIHRYESGASQPTADVIKKLAIALSATTDELLFDQDERRIDVSLANLMEGISRLPEQDKRLIREFIEGMLLKHAMQGERQYEEY